jgi:hypothetical protein
MFKSTNEVREFVARLRIPESRRTLVEVELLDHVESRIASGVAAGEDRATAEHHALVALGDPEALRTSLEHIGPAFGLDPVRAAVRGLGSALLASVIFAIAGALFPRGVGIVENLVVALPAALCGLGVMWLLAPRGIGAAIRSEIRAAIEPGRRRTAIRRAVNGYVGSYFLVFLATWGAWLIGLPESVRNLVLWSFGLLGLACGPYALYLMRGARKERAAARATRGP